MKLDAQQQQKRLLDIQRALSKTDSVSVLVVDDCAEDGQLAKEKLQEFDLDVAVTYDCEIATQMLAHNGFSVVFMDWKLVGKTGLDALRALKLVSHAHIIVLTGGISDPDVSLALSNGASAVMSKPLTSESVRLIFGTEPPSI